MINLLLLAIAAFFQNMAFTWVSRSRNGGDVTYHRYAALCSNAIWFLMQVLVMNSVWNAVTTGNWIKLLITAAIYTLATTEGSVLMMRILLKRETGKQRVGAR